MAEGIGRAGAYVEGRTDAANKTLRLGDAPVIAGAGLETIEVALVVSLLEFVSLVAEPTTADTPRAVPSETLQATIAVISNNAPAPFASVSA